VTRFDSTVDALAALVVDRPGTVVVAFLLVTGGLATGLDDVSTSAGTGQFTENSPEQAAYEDVHREFRPTFGTATGTTQLVHRSENVLSRRELLRMLEAQERLSSRQDLSVRSTDSAARVVARTLDPSARTLGEQQRTIETATSGQVDAAVRRAAGRESFRSLLSDDFDPQSATASATVGVVTHEVPGLDESAVGVTADSSLRRKQVRARAVVDTVGGDVTVFGSGIVASEFSRIIEDSLVIVVPAASILILVFLLVAYRDLFDLLLGVFSLGMVVVWTFGFMGLAGLPFSQLLIAVPPLLLAVGIDFGIHVIDRYREYRETDVGVERAMRSTVERLSVAFFIVTGTTILGFASNLTSGLGPIRDFGAIAAVGILFTFLVFGIFLPALKVLLDANRYRVGLGSGDRAPLGQEGSSLSRALSVGVVVARHAPRAFLLLVLVFGAGTAYYGTGVDTTFSDEDFLPPADIPDALEALPEPFAPGEYTVTETSNYLEDHFAASQDASVTVYLRAPMRSDTSLEAIQHAGRNPPDAIATEDGRARSTSVLTVVDRYAAESPEFRNLVARHDRDDDGVPDRDVEVVYDALLSSPYRDETLRYLDEDYRSARVVYAVEGDAEQPAVAAAGRRVADRYRADATATGDTIVFHSVAEMIFESAIRSLAVALLATALFLMGIYQVLQGRWSLGLVNLAPILVTVSLVVASMRALSVPFNTLTATLLAITIGLGIDYSAHVVQRFAEEFDRRPLYESLEVTTRGTGGALTGSVLTTAMGIGVLAIAITPILGTFGLLTALSIVYSFLTALLVTPSAIVLWAQLGAWRRGSPDPT
jgi:predicted RND superfamily exporter protein